MSSAAPEIILEPESHTYTVNGRPAVSVSRVLEQIDMLQGIPREYLERAAHFGKHVHLACHLYDADELDLNALDPALRPYLEGWARFKEDTGAHVFESELPVYHPRWGVAGMLDKLAGCALADLPMVIDLKSASTLQKSWRPQTAAYREALAHTRPGQRVSRKRACVHLTGDGKYKVHTSSSPVDLNIFVSAYNCHRWMEEK